MATDAGQNIYAAVEQLFQWKRYKEALKEAEQLLRTEPDDSYIYALVARIYLAMEQYEKSLNWTNEALKRDPEEILAWYVRVAVYYETNNEKAFQEAVEEALRIDPYEPHYYFLKANRMNKKGKFKAAKEQMLQALELSAETPLYLATLGYTEALLGNYEESALIDPLALRDGAEDPMVLLYLGWAAGHRGDYSLRETYMRSAVRLDPENKQMREEYLEALQQNKKLLRLFLVPRRLLNRLRPWQIFLIWIVMWGLFKPLVFLFIILYFLTHWITKGIVHVQVYGWNRKGT